jgi:hypothetical protein
MREAVRGKRLSSEDRSTSLERLAEDIDHVIRGREPADRASLVTYYLKLASDARNRAGINSETVTRSV